MLIENVTLINEGNVFRGGLLVEGDRIRAVFKEGNLPAFKVNYRGPVFDGDGGWLIPGVIDDQVHFREPGLTYKGDIFTESRAAAAGGITSFMEMPNTQPQTLSLGLLEEKYGRAAEVSAVNYSFYMGASNDNIAELRKVDPKRVCGVKVFMGASTGNMLVDNPKALEQIFAESPALVAVHSEDEQIIRSNMARYGEEALSARHHPMIRSREACIRSTEKALGMAHRHKTRLHILHISTAEEARMFDAGPVEQKKITAEVCVHHLWFSDKDYAVKGNLIKWNPAIKTAADRDTLRQALTENRLDVVATDHAPHSLEEKQRPFVQAPSGGPLVQHSLVAMMEMAAQGHFTREMVVDKMCHQPARLFRIRDRGFLRPGCFADLVLLRSSEWTVSKENIFYKCAWSPFEGSTFSHQVAVTWVNGQAVYRDGKIEDIHCGKRLLFG
jgi:dihydroorotase